MKNAASQTYTSVASLIQYAITEVGYGGRNDVADDVGDDEEYNVSAAANDGSEEE